MIARDPRLGNLLGPWRLTKPIGAGGMGTVYLGERADQQFEMRVAIKIVRFGLDTETMLHRFYRERQILAALQHPNIARLYDGGVTIDGFPYLVMEYIQGDRIDVCCNSLKLGVQERLFVFRKVCSAVRYLHSHLIVHCDLKPSNIMVTRDGEPKILDFGIARLADESDANTSTVMLFTPRYASPEQAQSKPITTRCDVYALGVILHELLTGHSPYGDDDRTPLELLRAVELFEPIPPSRSTPDPALARELAGDIDHIVLKALRKDPAERYASVEQFDDDIARHLEGLPVLARNQTLEYRTRKFVARNWRLVALGIVLAVALIGGLAATLYQAQVARRERALAERRFDQVRGLARLILFDFHDGVQRLPGSTNLQRELVDKTLVHLEGLASEAGNDPKLLTDLAESYLRLGNVQGNPYSANLGESAKALQTYTRALKMLSAIKEGTGPPDLEDARARLYRERGLLHVSLEARHEAKSDLDAAIRLLEAQVKREPDRLEHRMELGSTWGAVGDSRSGNAWARASGVSEIIEAYNNSISAWREVLHRQPGNARAQRAIAIGLMRIAGEEAAQDDNKALARLEAASAQLNSMAAAEKQNPDWQRLSGVIRINQAKSLAGLERYPEALQILTPLIEERRKIVAASPDNRQSSLDLLNTIKIRADTFFWANRFPEALTDYAEAIAMLVKHTTRDPADRGRKDNYADALRAQAKTYVKLGKLAEAEAAGRRALALRKELADDPGADAQSILVYAFTALEIEPEDLRQPREALAYYYKAKRSGKPVPKELDKWIAELEAQLSIGH